MKRLLCIIGAIGIGGCSGSIGGSNGCTTSGGGGVHGTGAGAVGGRRFDRDGRRAMRRSIRRRTPSDSSGRSISALGLSSAHDDFQRAQDERSAATVSTTCACSRPTAAIPVFGGDLVVHSNNAVFVGVGGNVLAGLSGLDLTPSLTAASAVATGQGRLRARARSATVRSRSIASAGAGDPADRRRQRAPRLARHLPHRAAGRHQADRHALLHRCARRHAGAALQRPAHRGGAGERTGRHRAPAQAVEQRARRRQQHGPRTS